MLKKLLSLTLAAMMIVSLFTLSASAVPSGSIGLRLESDAAIGLAVNTVVTVKVHYSFSDDEVIADLHMVPAAVCIAYDSEYYQYVAGSRTFSDYYNDTLIKSTSTINTTTAWSTISAGVEANENDNVKGYKNALIVTQLPCTGVTNFTPDPSTYVFSLQFKVIKAIDKEAFIGIPESTLTKQTQLKKYVAGKSVTLTLEQMDVTEGVEKSTLVSVNFADATRIRPNADNAANVDLGFTGSFLTAGIPIAFTGGRATNVSAVGVELTINGVTNTYEDNFVYLNANSNGYLFRVALTGISDTEYDTPIKARMFVTYNGVDYWSDYVYTTAGAHVGRLP